MFGASDGTNEHSDLDPDDYAFSSTPRQIRHVTSVQVRNLTPFPVRDAFASALKQPSEQPQFTTHGHFSDDLDVTLGRKRARRISAGSVATLNGLRHDSELEGVGETGARKRASSKASVLSGPGTTTSSIGSFGRRSFGAAGAPTVRPSNRPRTISTTSSHHSRVGLLSPGGSGEPGTSMSTSFSGLLRDTSQSGLEKVLQSRLVETFISLTLSHDPPPPSPSAVNGVHRGHDDRIDASSSRSSTPISRPSSGKEKLSLATKLDSVPRESSRRSTITASSSSSSASRSSASPKCGPASPSLRSDQFAARAKSASISHPSGKTIKSPSLPPAQKQRSPIPPSLISPSLASFPKKAELSSVPVASWPVSPPNDDYPAPDYLSPIHRRSTNPSFEMDPGFEFASGADLSGTRMRVEVWGRVERGIGWASSKDGADVVSARRNSGPRTERAEGSSKGKEKQRATGSGAKEGDVTVQGSVKGKERQREEEGEQPMEWKVLEGWDLNLGDLIPLPDELASHPSHLPSNTLLVRLSPPGRTFYLPSFPLRLHMPTPLSQPRASGYNSDPESDVRKVNVGETASTHRTARSVSEKLPVPPDAVDVDEKKSPRTLHSKTKARSAGWQDLLTLINLQTCILDIEQSLSDIVRVNYHINMSTREVSERKASVAELRAATVAVSDGSAALRHQINARRDALRTRKDMLNLARGSNAQVSQMQTEDENKLTEERDRLYFVQSQLTPMRNALIATLASIYPIELRSPPDLLFTILDVPLPIPPGTTDPAPPLSLPTHKDVTEDAVATSLGYAAQVVQLLAAYLGKNLVYPVTCIGSRSLIKDGISAMVGPRMFPLYSKGVDTYRFEYGVFLLNKDIELLMSDRNLRALDMRHTLPNLKNLLLTLTVNEVARIPFARSGTSTVGSISSLQSPILTPSEISATTVPELHPDGLPAIVATAPAGRESPPASGATTPDANPHARKSRAFLDLTPLAGFLRARYPSNSRQSSKSDAEAPETVSDGAPAALPAAQGNGEALQGGSDVSDENGGSGDDEDDRRTIRGAAPDPSGEGKAVANAHGNGHAENGGAEEKGGGEGAAGTAAATPVVPVVLVSGAN